MLQGKRIVAFVVGGVTRSEMRVAHKLSAKLGREILIGSTSCDTPTTFLKSLQVSPPSFVCNREHPSMVFVRVKCNMHVTQDLTTSACTLNIHLCFLLERNATCMWCRISPPLYAPCHSSVLCAGVPCNVHAMQMLNTTLRTSNRDLCFVPECCAVRM